MIRIARMIVLLTPFTVGCYTVRLDTIHPSNPGEAIPLEARVEVPPESAAFKHTVNSGLAGFANNWEVEVGLAVQKYAQDYLQHLFRPGNALTVRVDTTSYEVKNFAGTVHLRFTVLEGERTVLERDVTGVGKSYPGRVVVGGAFAMKSAMRRTLDDALRNAFDQFAADARATYPEWELTRSRGDAEPASQPEGSSHAD